MAATAVSAGRALPAREATGYRTHETLFATRYKQGGRTVYSVALSPEQIVNMIGRPDPDAATPGNRHIRPKHAQDFARYFLENAGWVSPGIILRAPGVFSFDATQEVPDGEFGWLTYPKRLSGDINILDGQHRILGFHMALQLIDDAADKARAQRADANRQDPDGAGQTEAERRMRAIEIQRERFYSERVSVEIQITDEPVVYKQMFFDIAEHALGITASVKARFDTRKVINRALPEVLEHPLLKERVDLEADRIGRGSPYLMGAKHVAEIVRSVKVGLEGRVSRRQDLEWSEKEVADEAKLFLDTALDSFPPLKAVTFGQLIPDDLRRTSLLGSVLMMRILAAAFHELKAEHAFTTDMVGAYFTKLAPHMAGPVYEGSAWMVEAPDEAFSVGAMGPSGRRQDLKSLKEAVVKWAILREPWLDDRPRPRPELSALL